MNKYLLIVLFLVCHVTQLSAKKRLSDNLIVKGDIRSIALVDDNNLLFAKENKIYKWDQSLVRITDSVDFHLNGFIHTIDYSPVQKMLAAGSLSGELFISNLSQTVETLPMQNGAIISLKFSNSGRYLAVGTADSYLSLWNIPERRLLWTKKGHNDHVLSICFDSNDSIVFSGSADGRIGLWNTHTGLVTGYLKESNGWVRQLAFSNEQKMLFAATDEGIIYQWKIKGENGFFIGSKKKTISWALALAVSENESFASGFKNGYFCFDTKFGMYHTNFHQAVLDVELMKNNENIGFYVAVLSKGLYFIRLADEAFKLSSK